MLYSLILFGIIGYMWMQVKRLRAMNAELERRLDPLGILKERYARGEISREEYFRMQNDLVQERAALPVGRGS
ncbi:MAG: SHOCT domain-containing protein [Bacillota bacterium]